MKSIRTSEASIYLKSVKSSDEVLGPFTAQQFQDTLLKLRCGPLHWARREDMSKWVTAQQLKEYIVAENLAHVSSDEQSTSPPTISVLSQESATLHPEQLENALLEQSTVPRRYTSSLAQPTLDLRAAPDPESPVIRTLTAFEEFTFNGESPEPGWLLIHLSNGTKA